ncbi:PDZ and LIM domain protein 7 isoform X17 [Gallus gallus]|uniref:PDZ and LIM domain protein 7 isoform X17 n=1 Tax=Gallus gallus TaxID=9031 RepID=UPI001F01892F|nr:PDZ and LIM domain protein 7 isoform X17 [Gallus gallus]
MSQSRLCPPRRARKVPAVPLRRGAAACPAPGPADSCQREHGASIPPARNPAEMGSHPEMGEMESYKVMLNGPAPWGFRLQGGKDFSMPLSISRLTPGGKAAQAGVGVGDWVLYIDGESTGTMTHIEAQNRIRACGDRLCLTLSRAQNHLGKPQKDSLPCSEPPKYNFAPSTALNKTARPFGASSPPNPRPGLVTKPVTYVPLAPACTPQHNGKPQEHPSSPKYDPSKLHLIEDSEDWQPRNTSTQSRSFLKLAQLTGTDSFEDHEDEPVRKPRGPRVSFWGTEEEWQSMHPPGTPACDPGKLRLMEDAEDWQPRTGTSQSRSFRKLARLTGTDGLEDHEDEPVRKPRDARGSFCGTEDQRQPPSHTEPPTAPACDPGKLRLMEDAEDWQPRTGTSQSRSFRKLARLTGTDGRFEDHEDEPVRKPRDARGSFSGVEEQWQPPPHVEPPTTPACDPGKLRLFEDAEDWQPRTGTSQSRSFRKLARLTGTDGLEDVFVKNPSRDARGSFCGTEEQRQPPPHTEPPTAPACDPGKLRLMEDAEDWQPRTGTSQSRSFRKLARLTGTDGLEDHEDEPVRKPRDARGSFCGTEDQRQPPSHTEPPTAPACDPGKLRLMEDAEDWQPRTGTSQSRSFRKLARLTGTDGRFEDHEDEPVRKPRDARGSFSGVEEQWQPPPHVEPPTTPACDPGKLRLFEDAEDWQPRTGTSQSRSFRKLARLTGTDGLEDDDVFIKKPSQVSVPDPSPGAAMKTEPGLAPRTPAATPGPTSRPPWAVDPSFAERYAPDKTSTVLSKHSQPATPTPMQNRSSIVQAAQQAPEGPGRTPLCYKCNKIIRGRYLVALGHYYHPEEFTCCQCRKVLDEGGFFEEKGSIFCPKCYDTRYAPSCAKCKKKITGEVMHALKMTWHVQCFTCAACKTPIRNRAFYMEEGQPYCERDYEKMFGTKCRGCDFKIDAGDRFLEALGFSWHDTCFVCAICQTNLEGKTFYSKKDKPLCKSHAFSHV